MESFCKQEFAGMNWCILSRYELKERLGYGGHGVVVSAVDKLAHSSVAIKKVVVDDAFSSYEAKRILHEVRLMRRLNHPNLINLLNIMLPSIQPGHRIDLYLVSELMSTDLRHVLAVAGRTESNFFLRNEQAQYLLYQLLCGVHYMASAGVLHRDLKPSNLLVDLQSCQLRICDFGLARAVPKGLGSLRGRYPGPIFERGASDIESNHKGTMTEYVVTRWYRAPELLLGHAYYGHGIDLWSTGCIFAEMLLPNTGVLFQGTERREMLMLIVGLLGRPSAQELWFVADENAREFIRTLSVTPQHTLNDRFSDVSPSSVVVSVPTPNFRLTVFYLAQHATESASI
mmetsp:Transcript_7170/g.22626  ORF Transcript_7170/g.22626 Transcript_7170/m.22626 type:complete len:343 (+) Transcript_7170:209-1237(+)